MNKKCELNVPRMPQKATSRAACGHKKKVKVAHTRVPVPKLIPVLHNQPAGYMSHEPGGRLPLLCARPAVTLATLKRTAADFAAW